MENNDNFNRILEMNTEAERRKIAERAMCAILRNPDEVYRAETCTETKQTPQAIAEYAVALADALIVELNKKDDVKSSIS